MAGEPEAQVTATGFPLPPPWFRLYKDGPESGPAPPRPVTDEFQVYDTAMNLDEPLVATHPNNMIQARPDGTIDYRQELQSLVPELLPLFLELLHALIETPAAHVDPLSRVSSALAAAQHLINLVRPEQARATLEYALELEVKEKEGAIAMLKAQVASLDSLLQEGAQQLVAGAQGAQ